VKSQRIKYPLAIANRPSSWGFRRGQRGREVQKKDCFPCERGPGHVGVGDKPASSCAKASDAYFCG